MRAMEIQNTDQIRPILEQVSVSTRSLPAMIMFAATSKTVLFLIINFIIGFVFPSAVWQVCKENEEIVNSFKLEQESVATVASRTNHDVKVAVTQAEPSTEEDAQGQSTFDLQPPFNPYLTNSKKQETRF